MDVEVEHLLSRTALSTQFRDATVGDVAKRVVGLARHGLIGRGLGEEQYLACLEETLALRKTPAERWLDKYNGEWAGDLTKIFDEAEM